MSSSMNIHGTTTVTADVLPMPELETDCLKITLVGGNFDISVFIDRTDTNAGYAQRIADAINKAEGNEA